MTTTPNLARPCGGCDAKPGQPCHPYCDYVPEQGDPTNTDRAERGELALTSYAENTRRDPDDHDLSNDDLLDEIARDTITDVLHRLARARVHPGLVLRQAYHRYREESLADQPGPLPVAAHALTCQECDAKPGQPCRWDCPSWGEYDAQRHTPTEQTGQ
ncbi:hypothetical protein AB0G05_26920 [Nonomuraea wenchangensis]